MALITWTQEAFGTNVAAHDEEHRKIFDMLNALHETTGGSDRQAIGMQLDALIAFVAEHFAAEQANMAKAGYAELEAHRQEHDKLVQTCIELQKKFHAGEAEVNQETTAFLADWLTNHIPKIDRAYGPALTAAGLA